MQETPRRGLREYEPGDTDWDHSDTIQTVEEDSIARGPIADRPAEGTYDDELYYATDQNIFWGWDESASDWTIRGGKGSEEQPVDAFYTESLQHIAQVASLHTPSGRGNGSRDFISGGPREMFVDPDAGSDDNLGTQAEPYQTIQKALDELPIIMQHQHLINLADGIYDEILHTGPYHFVGYDPHTDPFVIKGNPDDRTAVEIDGHVNLAVHCIEIDDAAIKNLQINGRLNNKAGKLRANNILFTGDFNVPPAGFAAHNASTTRLVNCTFQKPLDHAVDITSTAEVHLNKCDGVVADYAIVVDAGGYVRINDWGTLAGEEGLYDLGQGATMTGETGKLFMSDAALVDDFGDNRLTDRMSTSTRFYRPEWGIGNGSPVVEGGGLVMPAGDSDLQYIYTPGSEVDNSLRTVNGDWRIDFAFQSTPSTGRFYFNSMAADGSFRTDLFADGTIEVTEDQDGTETTLISDTVSVDTDQHSATFRRRPDIDGNGNAGVELVYDGTSLGTATTSYVPDMSLVTKFQILNQADAEVRAQTVEVSKPRNQAN